VITNKSSKREIRDLQRLLLAVGLMEFTPSSKGGKWGDETQEAVVRAYQHLGWDHPEDGRFITAPALAAIASTTDLLAGGGGSHAQAAAAATQAEAAATQAEAAATQAEAAATQAEAAATQAEAAATQAEAAATRAQGATLTDAVGRRPWQHLDSWWHRSVPTLSRWTPPARGSGADGATVDATPGA
jgi:pyruvate/2-oxoglutarate dehydrogenase complex dihydrolipoamide acyltransferase (E2) component